MPDDVKVFLKTVMINFGLVPIRATRFIRLFLRIPIIPIVPTGGQIGGARKVSEVQDAIGR